LSRIEERRGYEGKEKKSGEGFTGGEGAPEEPQRRIMKRTNRHQRSNDQNRGTGRGRRRIGKATTRKRNGLADGKKPSDARNDSNWGGVISRETKNARDGGRVKETVKKSAAAENHT